MSNYRYLLATLCVAIAGCATEPVSTSEAPLVPVDRVLAAELTSTFPGAGEMIVKRDRGFSGGGCSTRIFVNGRPVADLQPTEKVVIYMREGSHILSARPNGICGGALVEVKADVKAGSRSTYRLSVSGNGESAIYPTAF